jgi:hypothetical protein
MVGIRNMTPLEKEMKVHRECRSGMRGKAKLSSLIDRHVRRIVFRNQTYGFRFSPLTPEPESDNEDTKTLLGGDKEAVLRVRL